MQKKSVIIAVCLLAITLLTVACNKKKPDADAPIDYTIGEDGERYITNVYGDLIPVTTSKDGGVELIEDLMTKTKEQAAQEKSEMEKADKNDAEEPAGGEDKPGDKPNDEPNNKPEDKPQGGMQVGNNSASERDAVIVW